MTVSSSLGVKACELRSPCLGQRRADVQVSRRTFASVSGSGADASSGKDAEEEPQELPRWEFDKPSEFSSAGRQGEPTPILDAYERSRDPAEMERLLKMSFEALPPRDGPRRNNHKRRQHQKYRTIRVRKLMVGRQLSVQGRPRGDCGPHLALSQRGADLVPLQGSSIDLGDRGYILDAMHVSMVLQ